MKIYDEKGKNMLKKSAAAFLIIAAILFSAGCYSKTQEENTDSEKKSESLTSAEKIYTESGENFSSEAKESETETEVADSRENAITRAVKACADAVVGINVTEVKTVEYVDPFFSDPFFQRFFGKRFAKRYKKFEIKGLGSGFLISPDGYILTNYHVAGEASKIVATLTNGKRYPAKIIGADNVSDVALLKIEGENFPYLKLGNSDDCIVGEWVIAMGNPFGLFDKNSRPTVTVGVISNKNIDFIHEDKVYKGMIQTDAAISSGNSGGPLINALGEAIGMNTVIFSTAQSDVGAGSIGIGFSIPINRVKRIIDLLKKNGKIDRRYYIGMEVRDIDEDIKPYLDEEIDEGAVVFSVKRRSPADRAGVEPGDVILETNGRKTDKAEDYYIEANDGIAGEKLELKILRGGKILKKKIYLQPID